VLQYSQNVPDRETRAISGNLLEAMRFFGNARSDGAVKDLPGVCLITCGLNYAAFNAAVLSEPILGDAGQLRRNIETGGGALPKPGSALDLLAVRRLPGSADPPRIESDVSTAGVESADGPARLVRGLLAASAPNAAGDPGAARRGRCHTDCFCAPDFRGVRNSGGDLPGDLWGSAGVERVL
jgi:hypothetical protein